jgi:flagellin-like protein
MGGLLGIKGISPLVATVLLIAFVVSIAGLIAAWMSTFTKEQTQIVSDQSKVQVTCQYGKLNMKNLKYNTGAIRLAGTMENNGLIALGNISISIVYQNATSERISLCNGPSGAVTCSVANLTLTQSQQTAFNVTISGANYDTIKATSNCTTASDSADRGDVS